VQSTRITRVAGSGFLDHAPQGGGVDPKALGDGANVHLHRPGRFGCPGSAAEAQVGQHRGKPSQQRRQGGIVELVPPLVSGQRPA
jgi:hypothetical protein